MLSRVAERLYWMSRYLERAEDAARLCSSYSHLILDLPKGADLGWEILVQIIDSEDQFMQRYSVLSERNIIKFMIADMENMCSLRYSIKAVRENVRTTRDVLPEELWELVNEFYIYVNDAAEKSVVRRNRFEFLEEVISRSQQINGLIVSAVSRGHTYRFVKMGRLIERSDMVSRIVDVAAAAILNKDADDLHDPTLLWANMLKSISATSAYRREISPIVTPNEVVNFLFTDTMFPRSILFCINGIEEVLTELSNPEQALKALSVVKKMLIEFDAEQLSSAELHQFIDDLQEKLIDLNVAIHDSWFDLAGS